MSEVSYTEEELRAFCDKLQTWAENLDRPEQQLLGNLVGLAVAYTQIEAGQDDEVSGFVWLQGETNVVSDLSKLSFTALSRPRRGIVLVDLPYE